MHVPVFILVQTAICYLSDLLCYMYPIAKVFLLLPVYTEPHLHQGQIGCLFAWCRRPSSRREFQCSSNQPDKYNQYSDKEFVHSSSTYNLISHSGYKASSANSSIALIARSFGNP